MNTGHHSDNISPGSGKQSGIPVFLFVFLMTGVLPSVAAIVFIFRGSITSLEAPIVSGTAAIIGFLLIAGCFSYIAAKRFDKVELTPRQTLNPYSAVKPRNITHFIVFVRSKIKSAFHFTRSLDNTNKKSRKKLSDGNSGRFFESGVDAAKAGLSSLHGDRPVMEYLLSNAEFGLDNILSAMSDMIFVFDDMKRFTFAYVPDNGNPYFQMESFLGRTHNEVMPGEIHGLFNDAYDRCRSGESAEYEYSLVVNDEERWFLARLSPIMKDSIFDGSVAVVRDITQRKHAEEKISAIMADLKRSNTDLHEFALVASHDLKDPLVTVGGYLSRLQRKYTDMMEHDARQLLMRAVSGVLRMERLINEVLSLSHISANPLVFGEVDCNTALAEAVENLEEIVEKDGAVIISDPLPTVQGEHPLIVELFQNLLSNAIKHHVIRPPRILISAVLKSVDWEFSVEDNGPGIPAEHADKIFQIFARFDQVHPEGSGIGLAVCKKIVDLHGGRIWAESTTGKGSTFRFTIPAREKQDKTTGTGKNSTG